MIDSLLCYLCRLGGSDCQSRLSYCHVFASRILNICSNDTITIWHQQKPTEHSIETDQTDRHRQRIIHIISYRQPQTQEFGNSGTRGQTIVNGMMHEVTRFIIQCRRYDQVPNTNNLANLHASTDEGHNNCLMDKIRSCVTNKHGEIKAYTAKLRVSTQWTQME
jgi:hypothetical protein